MPVNERELIKRLDEQDHAFLRRYEQYLEQVMTSAEQLLEKSYTMQQIVGMPFYATGQLGRLLAGYSQDVLATGQAHAAILVQDLHRRFASVKLSQSWQPWFLRDIHLAGPLGIDPETFWLDPTAALTALEARENMLAGDVEGQLWQEVRKIMLQHLQNGSRKETIAAMSNLAKVNVRRAELITTTESTYVYNRGRLAGFHDADVDYLRFSATLDNRTSAQCRSRHGLVLRMGSAELSANIPPLHGRCRSVLSPLFSKYQPEYITPSSTDWSKVAPLPKGWKVAA
ncbi:minor capsid protein [Sporomusa sp. KB1]|jgi:SPP1 gp7 family putative phage head morphogenesis protein|uniref:minor capsid protein n=1 Tax=Sporomusa sp. KB1 TaxID=943346 RepID=UPI001C980EBD|nr:minor capsid protein [Sporomusa sp. KB1]